ncbi:MAG: serine--tRNA ligase, partial [Anaerolineae bacterium]|nr:serine--tRNA ligase [Anaerolineae bacterium]
DEQVRAVDAELEEHMLWLPNMPHESVPLGESDEQNIPHPAQGVLPAFDFEPQAHWDLGPALGIIDFERGVKLAGTRFYLLAGAGARLHRALSNWMLDYHHAHGREEMYTPFMVKEEGMYGAGQFPKFQDVVYFDPEAELYMLPTAEVSVTNMFRDEILEEAALPLRYVAHTPCFRKEKMSAGRDVRGIKRVHQFEKVEQYSFTTPEQSYAELERIVEAAEELCGLLGLPYRRLEICTGDLGFSASKKYDVEVWAAGSQEWLEVSSCSNTEAFQARRANIKYRPEGGGRAQFVHTLNGSGLALPRILIAIMENYQQADGSIVIPEVLRPYLGGQDVIRPLAE